MGKFSTHVDGKFMELQVNYPSPKGNGLLLNGSPD